MTFITFRQRTEHLINTLIYNQGLKIAIEYAYEEIKNCRMSIVNKTYYINTKDMEYDIRTDLIKSYKFCKHFIEEATKKEFSFSNKRHH